MKLFTSIILLLLVLNANAQMDSVLHSIEKNNLQLQSLRRQHQASALEMKSENVLRGPSVEYSPFYQSGYTGVASSELIASEEFDFPTQYAQRRRQMQLEESVAEKNYATARRDLLLSAKLLCLDVVRGNQVGDMLSRHLAQAEQMLAHLEKKMQAGDATILELNKAKLERMDVLKALAQNEADLQELLLQLQALNGGIAIAVEEREFTNGRMDELASLQDSEIANSLISQLVNSPEIAEAEAALKASEHAVCMSRQAWLPSITVGYRRNTEQNERLNGFLVGASFPLFGTSGKVKAAKARRESSELQLQEVRQRTATELRRLTAEMQSLRKVLDHTDTDLLRETLSLLDKALLHGEITTLQYYTETSEIYTKILNHIDLHCRYAKLVAEVGKNGL